MNRATRPSRPGLTGSASKSLLLSAAAGGVVLKAAPDTTTSTSLTWTEPEYKPDNYRVERSLDGTTFSTVTTLANTVFDYNDTGRTESTQYWYRIVPIFGGVDQTPSNIADTWTVPSTPTGLTATAISSTQINLAWTDVSTGNTAQSIQRRSPAGSGSYSFIASVGATANSYSDTGLIAATQYEYQVAATNPATQSAWSTAANATTTGGGPPSPSWTLDFSTGEPWANGTNYVFSSLASTTRTFVNSSGYVALCVANLLLQSQDFTTTWTNSNTTEPTTNNTAPDGTATADEIKESAATTSAYNIQQGSISVTNGQAYTFTVYAKANTATVIQLFGSSAAFGLNEWANFNISAGTVGSVGTSVTGSDATITSVGSGWYLCKLTMVATATTTASLVIGFTDNNSSAVRAPLYTVTAGNEKSFYAWGAQLVTGSDALPYSATTGSSNGIPRLTHNSSGSRLGLLVEGQRTNLVQRSAEFDNAYWTSIVGFIGTITANTVTAPDGTTNADTFTESTSNGVQAFGENSVTTTNGTAYTATIYAKAGTATVIQVGGRGGTFGTNEWANFDLSNGTIGSVGTSVTGSDATIENVGNGWYRCKLTMVATASATGALYCCLTNNNAAAARAILYTGTSKTLYLWGAQVEAASTASSYIPTTTDSVTREADIAYLGAVTNFGRPGSFVVEYYKPIEPNGHVLVAEDDVGSGGRLGLAYSSGGPRIIFGTTSAGSGGTDTAGLNKVGWAWNGSGAATRSAINGAAWDTSLATSFDPSTVTSIGLGGNVSDPGSLPITVSEQPNVIVRKITFYNSQLSAADLNTLTGPTSYAVEALVVAGGGGGGGSGTVQGAASGGGAGGYRTASGFTLTPGTSYTITVGAGGAGGAAGANSGSVGNNSVFSTITSDGGGNGRNGRGSGLAGLAGGNGGSGGGGGYGDTAGGAAGLGTSGQGNNGAAGWTNAPYHAGGGGGAGGAAVTLTNTQPGDGGAASASSISGSSVNYAGGGGGGGSATIAAGTAGSQGGNGGGQNAAGSNATANRGGGGGGAGNASSGSRAGGSGGSGVVILRMATANYSGVHTPATVTTSGSDTILTFTSSGNYVA